MSSGVFGLSTVTFLTVIGVPVVIIAVLALWGATFDARFKDTDVENKHGGEGV